jgi:Sec-independent protein secretion pathway component TatC
VVAGPLMLLYEASILLSASTLRRMERAAANTLPARGSA